MRGATRAALLSPAAISACALLCFLAAPAHAQSLRGVLSDRATYRPIDLGAVILVDEDLDTLSETITDERGYFSFALPESGEYYVIASALGYRAVRSEPVRVGAGETRVIEVSMDSRPLPVEGLVVEARADEPEVPFLLAAGFYDRLAEGRGEYLTPGQIVASGARYPQQLFWGMKTVRVHQLSHDRPGIWNDVLVLPNRAGAGYCRPSVYVDGIWIREEDFGEGESLADIVRKDELVGVEVYEWALGGVPPQYAGKQSCGVILLWTEHG